MWKSQFMALAHFTVNHFTAHLEFPAIASLLSGYIRGSLRLGASHRQAVAFGTGDGGTWWGEEGVEGASLGAGPALYAQSRSTRTET